MMKQEKTSNFARSAKLILDVFSAFAMPAAAFACPILFAATPVAENYDFSNGLPEGWTEESGALVSPALPGAVVSATISCSAGQDANARISARPGDPEDWNLFATLAAGPNSATFNFPPSLDWRQFKIATSGVFNVSLFSATYLDTTVYAPSNVTAAVLLHDAAEVSWSPADNAIQYEITAYTNAITGASDGIATWAESFDNMPGGTSALTSNLLQNADNSEEWTNTTFNVAKLVSAGGGIMIGDSSKSGSIVVPHEIESGENILLVSAFPHENNTAKSARLTAAIVGEDGTTNSLGSVSVAGASSNSLCKCRFELDDTLIGSKITLIADCDTADHRVCIDDISFVSGYAEGETEPALFAKALVSAETASYVFEGLPEGETVLFSVATVGEDETRSEESAYSTADLSGSPEKAWLNAVKIGSLDSLTYSQNFDTLPSANVTWFNGTTLPYWQLYKNAAAPSELKQSTGTATSGAFYSLSKSDYDAGHALGALTSSGSVMEWGLVFTNDTPYDVTIGSFGYSAAQWGFNNTTSQFIVVSMLVSDTLSPITADGDWISDSDWVFETPYTGEGTKPSTPQGAEMSELSPASGEVVVEPGQTLLIKWSFSRGKQESGSSAILGIDNFSIRFERSNPGFSVHIE